MPKEKKSLLQLVECRQQLTTRC